MKKLFLFIGSASLVLAFISLSTVFVIAVIRFIKNLKLKKLLRKNP